MGVGSRQRKLRTGIRLTSGLSIANLTAELSALPTHYAYREGRVDSCSYRGANGMTYEQK